MSWTDARKDALKQLVNDGRSASEIADELNRRFRIGVSRNAVIGMARRLDLHFRSSVAHKAVAQREQGRRERATKSPAPRSLSISGNILAHRAETRKDDPGIVAEPIVNGNDFDKGAVDGKALLDLNHRECRWPRGDDPRTMRFCAAVTDEFDSFCPHHREIATNPALRRLAHRQDGAAARAARSAA